MRTWLVLLLAACNSGGGDDYAISPGGGGVSPTGGIIRLIDANTGDGDALTTQARVCLIKDLRAPKTACDATKAGGFTVTVGSAVAMTEMDGSFSIALPSGVKTLRVTGTNLVTTVFPYTGENVIPAITEADFNTLTQENGFPIIEDGHGSLVVFAIRNALPLAGVTMALSPASVQKVFYDSDTAVWNESVTGTQTHGAFLAPDILVSTQQKVALTPPAGVQQAPLTVPIEERAITFVTQELQ